MFVPPCTEPGLFANTRVFMSAHTLNGQLEFSEEEFAEFDRKGTELQSWILLRRRVIPVIFVPS